MWSKQRPFGDCVQSLKRDDNFLADLMLALAELRTQPFHNPRLQTHTVGKAANGKPVFEAAGCWTAVSRASEGTVAGVEAVGTGGPQVAGSHSLASR